MKKAIFIIGLTAGLWSTTHAQHVQIMGDANLDSLVQQNITRNSEANGITGYRVQIFFGSDRKAANEARTRFLQLYPEVEAYLVYQQPNFKVRIGDYRSQLEAQRMYRQLLTQFDKVFIVPDKINLPRL